MEQKLQYTKDHIPVGGKMIACRNKSNEYTKQNNFMERTMTMGANKNMKLVEPNMGTKETFC
jgi:hypothetical protein